MKPLKALIFALVLTFGAAGQENPVSDASKQVIKIIDLKHLRYDRSDRLNRVADLARNLMLGKPVQFVSDPVLNFFAIKGTPEAIAEAEQILKRFDVPAAETGTHQISLTLYLLETTSQPDPERALPAELTSVVGQMRSVFGGKQFQVVDTLLMRGRENSEFNISGILPTAGETTDPKTIYDIFCRSVSYSQVQKTVAVTNFRFLIRFPVGTTYAESSIRTDLTLREGQKLVLGKLSKDRTERPLFVAVTATVD